MRLLTIVLVSILVFLVAHSPAKAHAPDEFCEASYYGPGFYGALTASGEPFAGESDYTMAHPTLPFGTVVYAHSEYGGAYFRVNDRGPYVDGRCADFSQPWIVGYGTADVMLFY